MQDNYLLLTIEGGSLYVRGNLFAESPVILENTFPVRNLFFLFCMFMFLSLKYFRVSFRSELLICILLHFSDHRLDRNTICHNNRRTCENLCGH